MVSYIGYRINYDGVVVKRITPIMKERNERGEGESESSRGLMKSRRELNPIR